MRTYLDVGRVGLQVVLAGRRSRFHDRATTGGANSGESSGEDEGVGDGSGSVGVVEGVDAGNGEVESVP